MAKVLISPGKYVQGAGEMKKLGEYAQNYGKKALILISKGGYKRIGAMVEKSFEGKECGYVFDYFNGECSKKEIKRLGEIVNEVGRQMGFGERFGDHIYHTIGFNVVRREEYFKEHVSPDFPMEEFTENTRRIYHRIMEEDGVDRKPGAEELLKYAKEHGYRLALATSSRELHIQIRINIARRDIVCHCQIVFPLIQFHDNRRKGDCHIDLFGLIST